MGSICGDELQRWEKTQAGLESGGEGERIRVAVRLRPLNAKEIARNDVSDWECINDTTIIYRHSLPDRSQLPSAYTFDRVFRCECSTKQVYEEAAKEVALSVVSGINSSIFAYGQTSSGKTYTMSGITEHTLADIYEYIQKHEERVFILKFSAMEIYNEAVRDLLILDGTPLRLLDDPERGVIVERLTEATLRDWGHLQELLDLCEAQRQIGETNLNETSSRSHQILKLTVESSAREFMNNENSSTLYASVNFVDLAGSERASQALSAGARLKEGCHINRSLLTLGTVIRKLSKGRGGHIPYRDSKLTRILQSSLGGNARTAIICTMSPARSHTEQSRNTLLFAACAKEVATSAQVNVVMSDKALVKHLQKELARLESELRGAGPGKDTSHSQALLREKDAQIQKMEHEIKELIQQRDLSQSRLEDLLRVVGDDEASREGHSHASDASEHEYSSADSLGVVGHALDSRMLKFHASKRSKEYSDDDSNEEHLQIPEISEDQMLLNGSNLRVSIGSPLIRSFPQKGVEQISHDVNSDAGDSCKEVRCIEVNTGKKESNEQVDIPLPTSGTTYEKDQESNIGLDSIHTAMEKQIHGVQKSINSPLKPYCEESCHWPLTIDLSSFKGLRLSRSRSCRASLMASSYSPLFQPAEQNENTPPGDLGRDFPGRPKDNGCQKRLRALSYENEEWSRKLSENSRLTSSGELLNNQNSKSAAEESITSIRSFVKGLKEMAQLQYERQFMDDEAEEGKAINGIQSKKTSRDVGLDPMQIPPESPSKWPVEFDRLQREIFELWDACNVSLVHRTYFFLLFKGDPADSIYMEVEQRRLSFLRNTFSQGSNGTRAVEDGRIITPASSAKAIRREREMLSKQMLKRLSEEERERLFKKWGIGLDTKQRRVQLGRLLWTKTDDIDHIKASADVVARSVGFQADGQALKEMFGLSFSPQWGKQRSQSWKNGIL